MSIRGIDTQIMITRAADLARDASALQRTPQYAQENTALRTIQESAENQSRVLATEETENENVKPDAEGAGSGAAGGGPGRGEEEQEEEQEQERELLAAAADYNRVIDIVI